MPKPTRAKRRIPRIRVSWLVCVFVLAATGCRSNPRYELIESELRTRERELLEARAELQYARQLNQTYQRGLSRQSFGTATAAGAPTLPIKEIVLGSGTGGADNDQQPGDESLQVVIVPRDEEGSSVKVPATVVVEAFEVGRNGLKTPIGRWDVTPEMLRRTWRGGLFATGYYLLLQWDQPPRTERLRISVRLTTLDSRPYEADRDVSVRPLPGVASRGIDLPPPGVGVAIPEEGIRPIPAPGLSVTPLPGVFPTIPPPDFPPRVEELPAPQGIESRKGLVRVRPAVSIGNAP